MPVFTVSENTWPQVGFSRNRWIRPSSSAITMPNSSGSGTRVSATVTIAPCSLWNRTMAVRSMSVSASPEMTRNGSARRPSFAVLAQRVFGVLDAARGAERHLLGRVLQVHPEVFAVGEVVTDQGGQELDGHDGVGEPVPAQQPEHVLHDRPIGHG